MPIFRNRHAESLKTLAVCSGLSPRLYVIPTLKYFPKPVLRAMFLCVAC